MHKKLAVTIGLAAIALGASVGFSQSTQSPNADGLLATRQSGTAGQENSNRAPNGTRLVQVEGAQLVCLHKIQVAAQSDGLIQALLTDEGELVTKGDTLLKIDDRVATAELEVARKELEAAVKQAAQTADVEYAKKASAVSDEEYRSEKELYEKNSSTYSQAQRKKLEAERARLGIDVAVVKHETEGLAADVAAAKVDAAKVKLDLYSVLAPYDGVIVERLRDEGEWIRAGEPVLRLVHMNEMKIEGMVGVGNFSLVELQNAPMKVTVTVSPIQKYDIPTQVEFVSPEFESGRVRVSAKIQNQKVGDTWLLRDGMAAEVSIELPVTQ